MASRLNWILIKGLWRTIPRFQTVVNNYVLDSKPCGISSRLMKRRTQQRSLSSLFLHVTPWKSQLLTLFPALLLSWSQKNGNNFGTVTQDTSYNLQAVRSTVCGYQLSLSRRDEVVINRLKTGHICDAHILTRPIACRPTSAHDLSSTSLLNVLSLTIFATNISLFALWRNCLVPYRWVA